MQAAILPSIHTGRQATKDESYAYSNAGRPAHTHIYKQADVQAGSQIDWVPAAMQVNRHTGWQAKR